MLAVQWILYVVNITLDSMISLLVRPEEHSRQRVVRLPEHKSIYVISTDQWPTICIPQTSIDVSAFLWSTSLTYLLIFRIKIYKRGERVSRKNNRYHEFQIFSSIMYRSICSFLNWKSWSLLYLYSIPSPKNPLHDVI